MSEVAELDPPEIAHVAAGVAYTESPFAPGLKLFACAPYKATMTTSACALRWEKAQDVRGEDAYRFAHCRRCPIGSEHAGRGVVRYSQHHKTDLCLRCGSGGRRIISNRVCVSCKNREYELRKLKNGRGNLPVELLANPLRAVELIVDVDGEARRIRDRFSSGITETVLMFLKTHTGEISFGRAPGAVQPWEPGEAPSVIEASDREEPPASDPPAAADYWELTDRRCETCQGRVLRNAASPELHRCADCGADGEGSREAPAEVDGVGSDEITSPAIDPKPAAYRFRMALFATSALTPMKRTRRR